MFLSQDQLDRGNSLLNEQALYIEGKEISLYVHYWGGERALKSNTPHKHSFFEVCYIVDGYGIYIEQGREYTLEKGMLLLTRPHVKHQIISKENLNIIFCAFEPIYAESTKDGIALIQSLEKADTLFLENEFNTAFLWKALILQSQKPKMLIHDTIVNLCGSLIFSMIQRYLNDKESPKTSQSKGRSTTLIYRAKLYIRDNLAQSLKLKDVAEYLHVSNRHLSRLFTDELGITFTQYVRNERINKATKLLSTTDLPIKTVSNKVGFETVHYFTTVFKQIIGTTPGEFSRKLTSNF